KRIAYRRRPDAVEALKAEFLRTVNDIADRHEDEQLDSRAGHHELTGVMRRFVRRTTGHDVTSQDLATLLADPRTRAVGELIGDLYEPDFAMSSSLDVRDSVRRAREVIRTWSGSSGGSLCCCWWARSPCGRSPSGTVGRCAAHRCWWRTPATWSGSRASCAHSAPPASCG